MVNKNNWFSEEYPFQERALIAILLFLLSYLSWVGTRFLPFVVHPVLEACIEIVYLTYIGVGVISLILSFAIAPLLRAPIILILIPLALIHLVMGVGYLFESNVESTSYETYRVGRKTVHLIHYRESASSCDWVGECCCYRCDPGSDLGVPQNYTKAYVRHWGVFRKVMFDMDSKSEIYYENGKYYFDSGGDCSRQRELHTVYEDLF